DLGWMAAHPPRRGNHLPAHPSNSRTAGLGPDRGRPQARKCAYAGFSVLSSRLRARLPGMSTTFKATIEHVHHTTSRASVRSHTMLVDRGVAKGGFDLGPA